MTAGEKWMGMYSSRQARTVVRVAGRSHDGSRYFANGCKHAVVTSLVWQGVLYLQFHGIECQS